MRERKKKFARTLRKQQTPSEQKVWELLKDRRLLGLKFRRQHVIEGFVVDFYCMEYKLAIEIDGPIHLKQKHYDELRQDLIESKGITFARVTNNEIKQNMVPLIRKIKKVVLLAQINPSPSGRGGLVQGERVRAVGSLQPGRA